jgi:capsular exopolysaccharide synthesis family protein
MVTSSLPYEGKSTIIGNLAIILSQTGAKVLLLDCDLRRPSMHKLYGHKKSPGLTELLAGDTNMDAIIHNTEIPGLDFISAGTTPPNPAELLGSDKMKNMLQTFRDRYDVILLDAPPVLSVTDALLLSSMTDMVFMVLELGRVPIKAAVHVRELLQNVSAPLAGIVLNDKSKRGFNGTATTVKNIIATVTITARHYSEEPAKQNQKEFEHDAPLLKKYARPFTDYHCHILPGLDDGPVTERALKWSVSSPISVYQHPAHHVIRGQIWERIELLYRPAGGVRQHEARSRSCVSRILSR